MFPNCKLIYFSEMQRLRFYNVNTKKNKKNNKKKTLNTKPLKLFIHISEFYYIFKSDIFQLICILSLTAK